jgi:hypothetical protein
VNCRRRPNVESTTIESNETMTPHAPETLTVDLARVARERCGILKTKFETRHALFAIQANAPLLDTDAVLPLAISRPTRLVCVWLAWELRPAWCDDAEARPELGSERLPPHAAGFARGDPVSPRKTRIA